MLGLGETRDYPTVLIIDDDLVSREVMATVLTMSGYTIHTAPQGEDAVALLDAGACRPDVILMDAQMPGLHGEELVRELRARSVASIYAMSGSDVPDDVKAAVDGYLSKPFGPHALQLLMEQHHLEATLADPCAPVLNAETLAQFRGMMKESAVREIYDAVLSDLGTRLTQLAVAFRAADGNEVRRIGHAIKGGCSMAGALEAAGVGARLEARGDQVDDGSAVLRELETARRNLQRMLETEFPAQRIRE